ncbi:MAG TPA: hypothetical protein VMT91_06775 [Anaerolineales bacterium]|nr:hypothetical protein [Anaerolineales bacterium]
MNINLTQLAPYIWIVGIILVVILAFIVIRFFWRHVLKYLVHGCLGLVGILILLALLHYIFKIF